MLIVYSGSVVSNGGDAAIMQAQVRVLAAAFDDVRSIILDSEPAVAAKIFPEYECRDSILPFRYRSKNGRLASLLKRLYRTRLLRAARRIAAGKRPGPLLPIEARSIALIASADLLAYTGGTTLTEKYRMLPKLIELEVAAAMGKPTVLLPQSLGPFAQPESRDRMREVVANAAKVLVRDTRSRHHLAEIGADMSMVEVTPDIVFAATSPGASRVIRESVVPARPQVVISARSIAAFSHDGTEGQARYDESMLVLVTHLVRTMRATVVFASTCQGLSSYNHDDSATAQTIADRLPVDVRRHVRIDREFHTPDQLHDLYASFDLAVVTRLHAGITALNEGVPVLAIAYEFKTHEVMGALGLGEYVVDIAELGGNALCERFDRFVGDLPSLRPLLADRLEQASAAALDCGRVVAEAVRGT